MGHPVRSQSLNLLGLAIGFPVAFLFGVERSTTEDTEDTEDYEENFHVGGADVEWSCAGHYLLR
jgi:hypothetical protein